MRWRDPSNKCLQTSPTVYRSTLVTPKKSSLIIDINYMADKTILYFLLDYILKYLPSIHYLIQGEKSLNRIIVCESVWEEGIRHFYHVNNNIIPSDTIVPTLILS